MKPAALIIAAPLAAAAACAPGQPAQIIPKIPQKSRISANQESPTSSTVTVTSLPPGAPAVVPFEVWPAQPEPSDAAWWRSQPGAEHAGTATWYAAPAGTTASRDYPKGTRLKVCAGDACTVVTVDDYGPAEYTGHSLDLSEASFAELADPSVGVLFVTWSAA